MENLNNYKVIESTKGISEEDKKTIIEAIEKFVFMEENVQKKVMRRELKELLNCEITIEICAEGSDNKEIEKKAKEGEFCHICTEGKHYYIMKQ